MSEAAIMRQIQVGLSVLGARLLRNNVGKYEDKEGNWVQYGLCIGSSDLIGWMPITVTQEMIGMKIAVFSAVEVKTETGRTTPEQVNFIEAVKRAGGIAVVARSLEDAESVIKNFCPPV